MSAHAPQPVPSEADRILAQDLLGDYGMGRGAVEKIAAHVAASTAQIKSEAAVYKRLFDGLVKLRPIESGTLDEWVDAMLASAASTAALREELRVARERTDALEKMGDKVNVIRNSIVGFQGFNFSEHAYPLVAALNAAGFEGQNYPEALAYFGSMLDRTNAAESARDDYRKALAEVMGDFWSAQVSSKMETNTDWEHRASLRLTRAVLTKHAQGNTEGGK